MDLIVGTRRLFGLQAIGERQLVQLSRALGQDLFDPPNVKGWPGGVHWISSHT